MDEVSSHAMTSDRPRIDTLKGSAQLVWTPDPSGCVRKGLGNNLAQKFLECWNAGVSVDEGKNATSAKQRLNSTDNRK